MKIKKKFSLWPVLFIGAFFAFIALQLPAFAEEEDIPLPPPAGSDEWAPPPTPPPPSTPSSNNTPAAAVPETGSLSEDPYLPQENANTVQKDALPDDGTFLPPAEVSPEPVEWSAPVAPSSAYTESYERRVSGMDTRPGFGIMVGGGSRFYPSTLVVDRVIGADIGVSIRFLDLGKRFSLNFVPGIVFIRGTMTHPAATGVRASPYEIAFSDLTTRLGIVADLSLSRSFSFLAGVYRTTNHITPQLPLVLATDLNNIELKDPAYRFGGGFQWDFHVIPHGSLGLRGYMEPDYALVSLVMNVEPAPKKKVRLNHDLD